MGSDRAKVSVLGPQGTYSHHAAQKIFKDQADHILCANFQEIYEKIAKGESDYGVVPLENNSAGLVDAAFDLLIRSDSIILGEFTLPIVHSLLSLEDDIKNIKILYSLPHPYFQCSDYIETRLNRDLRWIQSSSSTQALKDCLANPTQSAAIGFADTGKELGLKLLESGIQDLENNSTRFALIARPSQKLPEFKTSGNNKASIVFTLDDKPGTLLEILKVFHQRKLNLCHIESRPTRKKEWKYYFCLTAEGPSGFEEALQEVCQQTPWHKILGIYPVIQSDS